MTQTINLTTFSGVTSQFMHHSGITVTKANDNAVLGYYPAIDETGDIPVKYENKPKLARDIYTQLNKLPFVTHADVVIHDVTVAVDDLDTTFVFIQMDYLNMLFTFKTTSRHINVHSYVQAKDLPFLSETYEDSHAFDTAKMNRNDICDTQHNEAQLIHRLLIQMLMRNINVDTKISIDGFNYFKQHKTYPLTTRTFSIVDTLYGNEANPFVYFKDNNHQLQVPSANIKTFVPNRHECNAIKKFNITYLDIPVDDRIYLNEALVVLKIEAEPI